MTEPMTRLTMISLWWTQIKAVIRLEMKKTFFARRGLWIYILALLPIILFIVHAVIVSHERERSREIARQSEKTLTYQDLLAVRTGMTTQEVVARLGKPPVRFHWNERQAIRVTSAVTGTGGSGTPVNLAPEYNLNGIYADGTSFTDNGLDGAGYVYSSNLLTANRILNGIQFNLGPADQPDAVYGAGQLIKLPAGQFATLRVLAAGIYGPVLHEPIIVTYTDSTTSLFTQSFSDWCGCVPNPGEQPGESLAVVMPYRVSRNGVQDNQESYLYGYTFALNPDKTVQSLTLPDNRNVIVLAATLATQSQGTKAGPSGQVSFADISYENYRYSDGTNDLLVNLTDGKVVSIDIRESFNLPNESVAFAAAFQFFYLRLAVFFGCLGIFMNLFRGEILDKSLHFYFLAPIRRDVLMVGKFLAGLLATCVIFVTSELLQIVALIWSFSPNVRNLYLYQNHGLTQAAAYLGITALACLGYGAFFLAAGMLFKNPILPAAAILVWEAVNPFLPALLKKFSVIYYLKSLCPVDVPSPPGMPPLLSLLVSNPDPVSTPVAILGIVIVALLVLYASGVQVRRMEINYTSE
jgi:ABC-type transport system involved in multi-copper enzyme maturation permease subunit